MGFFYGSEIKVLEPEELRNKIIDELGALDIYGEVLKKQT